MYSKHRGDSFSLSCGSTAAIDLSCAASGAAAVRQPQHRKEVTGRTQQDEPVPPDVAIPPAFRRIEGDPGGVCEPPRNEPEPGRHWHVKPKAVESRSAPATHAKVQRSQQPRVPDATYRLQRDSENGQIPHDPKQRPAPGAA